jgi:hypothetical protein
MGRGLSHTTTGGHSIPVDNPVRVNVKPRLGALPSEARKWTNAASTVNVNVDVEVEFGVRLVTATARRLYTPGLATTVGARSKATTRAL